MFRLFDVFYFNLFFFSTCLAIILQHRKKDGHVDRLLVKTQTIISLIFSRLSWSIRRLVRSPPTFQNNTEFACVAAFAQFPPVLGDPSSQGPPFFLTTVSGKKTDSSATLDGRVAFDSQSLYPCQNYTLHCKNKSILL